MVAHSLVAPTATTLLTIAPTLLHVSILMYASISTPPLVANTEPLSALKFGSSSSSQTTSSTASNEGRLAWRARSQSCWSLVLLSSLLHTSVGRDTQVASGFDRKDEDEDRHRLVVVTEAQPIPTVSGPRQHNAPMSMVDILKVRVATLQAISFIHSHALSLIEN